MKIDDAKTKIEDLVDLVRDYDFKGNIESLKDIDLKSFKDLKELAKFRELLKKNEEIEEKKKNNTLIWILAIIGGIIVCAAIGYAIYRFLVPDYIEDSFEEFEDFDDDFFEDEDELTDWDDEEDAFEVDAKPEEASSEATEE